MQISITAVLLICLISHDAIRTHPLVLSDLLAYHPNNLLILISIFSHESSITVEAISS